jgi:acyl-CoA thioesterase II
VTDESTAARHAGDLAFHGVDGVDRTADGAVMVLPVLERLCNPHGILYGGTGVSAATVVAEHLLDRPLTWITVQFVQNATPGEVLHVRASVLAGGRRSAQVRVEGHVGDRLVFTALGAHSDRPASDARSWGSPPAAPPRETCIPFALPVDRRTTPSFLDALERLVPPTGNDVADGHLAMWVRVPEWHGPSAARLGYVADVVPVAIFMAADRAPGASSLDNTVRIIDDELPDGGWMLFDVEAEGLSRSIGHGRVRIWSDDGRLLAIGSQSAIMRAVNIGDFD